MCKYEYREDEIVVYSCSREVWEGDGEYCIFHSKKLEEKKEYFKKEFEKERDKEPEKIILNNQETGQAILDYIGFIFPEDIRFESCKFEAEAAFLDSRFSGHASFKKAQFCRSASFQDAQFGRSANFTEVLFSKIASFSKAQFIGGAFFYNTQLCGDAYFLNSQFSGIAGFSSAKFSGFTYFMDAQFGELALFEKTQFLGEEIYFVETQFKGSAIFRRAQFIGNSIFREAQFHGRVDFSDSHFIGFASFSDAHFNKGDVYFRRVLFDSNADFSAAHFSGNIDFSETQFSGEDTYFPKTQFNGNASFKTAQFKGYANFSVISTFKLLTFEQASVKKTLNFSGSVCKGNVSLEDTEVGYLKLDNLNYCQVLSIIDTKFTTENPKTPSTFANVKLEKVNFVNIDLSYVSFQNAFIREINFDSITLPSAKLKPSEIIRLLWHIIYVQLPVRDVIYIASNKRGKWLRQSLLWGRPNEAIYEETMVARVEKDEKKRKSKFRKAETVYRSLKHVMEKQHSFNLARKMRAGELECKLHSGEHGFNRIFLYLYRFFNGFGMRWSRAFVFWLVSILAFAGLYNGQLAEYRDLNQETQQIKSVTDTINPMQAIWHSFEMTTVIKTPSMQIADHGFRWIEGSQRIISPLLFFLILQAIRNVTRD